VGRSVSFTLLPAEMVQTTVVYKSQDASLLEGGVAGLVDLRTPHALGYGKQWVVQLAAEAAYNSLTHSTKPQVNGTLAWRNDAATFGVAVQGFYEDRSVERFGQETLGYEGIDATMPLGKQHPELIGVQAPILIGSTLFQQEKTREGGRFDVEYRPDDRMDISLDGFYSKLDATNHNDNYMYWGSRELARNLPTSFTVANNTLTSANFPLIVPTTPFTTGPGGFAGSPVEGLVVDNIIRPGAGSYTWYINLDGKFKVTDHLTLHAQVGDTEGQGKTKSSPSFEVDGFTGISYAPSGNGWVVVPANINPASPAGLANDWAWNETFTAWDKEVYGQVDGDYDVDSGVFKDVAAGFRAAQHTRRVDGWDRGCSLGANGMCWSSPPMPFSATNPTPYPSGFNAGALGIPGLLIPIAGDPNTIINILNSIHDGVHGPISAINQPQNYYWPGSFKVQEDDYEGYLLAHVQGDNWRGNFGVRLVETQENAFTNVSDPSGTHPGDIFTSAFGPYYVDHVRHDYFNVLPSVNFTFDLMKNLALKVSAAETMSRPDYSALGGTVTLTDLTHTGNGGNPDLRPVRAAVYSGSLEWYYQPTALAAVSLFYDDLSSYVTFGTHSQVYQDQFASGQQGHPVFASYNISSPSNVSGEVKGVELQVQQPLPYNFGFLANLTWLEGHDDHGNALVGTSNVTYNLIGYYEISWVNARLAYTWRSHYFVGLDRGADESEAGYGQLDASVNFTVTPNVTISVDALNLTDELLKYYAQNRTQVRAVYENGTQVYAGLHVKF
jgi:iron complex outermembrane receptor protein